VIANPTPSAWGLPGATASGGRCGARAGDHNPREREVLSLLNGLTTGIAASRALRSSTAQILAASSESRTSSWVPTDVPANGSGLLRIPFGDGLAAERIAVALRLRPVDHPPGIFLKTAAWSLAAGSHAPSVAIRPNPDAADQRTASGRGSPRSISYVDA
jgi:hypothetical protein